MITSRTTPRSKQQAVCIAAGASRTPVGLIIKKPGIVTGLSRWCRRPDSNRHGLRHYPLKIACLPIPPLRLKLLSFGRTGRVTGGFCGLTDG